MDTPEELTLDQRLSVRFRLNCFAALLPRELRPAALDAWAGLDPALFVLGLHDPPARVSESVLALGSSRVRAALATAVRDPEIPDALVDLDDTAVDVALGDNAWRSYELECRVRLRNPVALTTGRWYRRDHPSRALLSADPDLAGAALVDPTEAGEPTVRAAAWSTVLRHGGMSQARAVASALPRDPDPVGKEVLEALAEAMPEPFLDTALERRIGTGALLRRLRALPPQSPWGAFRAVRKVLDEPYRIDWALLAAARLGSADGCRAHGCARSGRACGLPARGGRGAAGRATRASRPTPAPAPARAGACAGLHSPRCAPAAGCAPVARVATARPDRSAGGHRVFRAPRPAHRAGVLAPHPGHGDTRSPRSDHRTRAAGCGRWAQLAHPAHVVVSWVGEEAGCADVARASWRGRAALHVAVSALLARWAAGEVPAERWAVMYPLIRLFPGSLPELLDAVDAASPESSRVRRGKHEAHRRDRDGEPFDRLAVGRARRSFGAGCDGGHLRFHDVRLPHRGAGP
ncbi:hypothetical protein [Kitasatospora sp. NPDC050543]|uniref:hypothetical protein n=1 Tax=Kitasatospora sp. NPDC050543 TaxID=3364054 RepID=UPI0037BD14DD